MTKRTVTILPETTDTALFLHLRGTITREDYLEFFDGPVKEIADRNGFYNLYVYHDPDFIGWNEDAASLSFKCISEYGPRARCLAYVNPPDSRRLLMRMLQPIMHAELRFYEDSEQDEAKMWMQSCIASASKKSTN